MESNERDRRSQSSKFGYEASRWRPPDRFCQRNVRRSAFGNGKGTRRTPWTTLNIAVFAPTLKAMVSAATQVKPRLRVKVRRQNRRPRETVSARSESNITQ